MKKEKRSDLLLDWWTKCDVLVNNISRALYPLKAEDVPSKDGGDAAARKVLQRLREKQLNARLEEVDKIKANLLSAERSGTPFANSVNAYWEKVKAQLNDANTRDEAAK
eukprot:3026988-Rhodomonas_salina.1